MYTVNFNYFDGICYVFNRLKLKKVSKHSWIGELCETMGVLSFCPFVPSFYRLKRL